MVVESCGSARPAGAAGFPHGVSTMNDELRRLRDAAFERFVESKAEGEFGEWLIANGERELFERVSEAEELGDA